MVYLLLFARYHSAACLLLHLLLRPFRAPLDNALETASLALIMLTTMLVAPYPEVGPLAFVAMFPPLWLRGPLLDS